MENLIGALVIELEGRLSSIEERLHFLMSQVEQDFAWLREDIGRGVSILRDTRCSEYERLCVERACLLEVLTRLNEAIGEQATV